MRQQLKIIQLTEADLGLIQAFGNIIDNQINDLVKSFYSTILEVPELKTIVTNHSGVDQPKDVPKSYIHAFSRSD